MRSSQLKISEIVFIAIWYKCSHFNNFKAFFFSLKQNQSQLFRYLPCYQRMVHLISAHQLALHALHFALMKDCQSHYLWIDSTTLPVCKNQRIQWHKSLAAIATRGKSSMGWFFGCKLHLIMNQSGDMVSTALSNGHTADIKMVEQLVKGLKTQGADLIKYNRKNMKSVQLSTVDEYHLKQRNKIETLFSLLKGKYHLVTSKARSIEGYLAGIYASLCAYQLCHQNKPTIRVME